MTPAQTNYLNIILILISGLLAVVLPFELFLFSYIILGPLHYLTELSWLHKRRYFVPGQADGWLLAGLTLLILLPTLLKVVWPVFGQGNDHAGALQKATDFSRMLVFVAFAASAVLLLLPTVRKRAVAMAVIVLIGWVFQSHYFITILFAVFVPTLIHVFVFTGAFMLTGALKSRDRTAGIAFLVFLAVPLAILLLPVPPIHQPSPIVTTVYNAQFIHLNEQVLTLWLHRKPGFSEIFYSPAGTVLTRFIAFAYTYHYLNWFSKTSIIGWLKVPRKALVATLVTWLAAVALYFYHFRTGLAVLYFLSMIHVIFEFPLNIHSFRDIATSLRRWPTKPGALGK